ncbi:glycoside hydrolase family 37 protein [Daedalea quercina L-15889]|uniref:Trehalase n=1 Tax=Daedalea quercina L-15889 TaxID=1314783 RepID=A0A165RID6_9APHY|nr:glycoside hydrolase family 37 protein [Daedalea quercina L-15889]
MLVYVARLLILLQAVGAVPQFISSSATPALSVVSSASSDTATSVSTAVASASASASAIPSSEPLPPVQPWCISEIFCAGALLQDVNLAEVYSDPKTIVDKPTSKSSQQVLAGFAALQNSSGAAGITEGDIVSFEDDDFTGEGQELAAVTLTDFNDSPAFLENVTDPLIQAWAQIVSGYWADLIRETNTSATCPIYPDDGDCEGTFIPLNHTFVIPGGRFREQYYWDSYWIIQGLIQSELYDIANSTLQNFMDEIDTFGFIPNGGRIYYLDRSQPPMFTRMVADYVAATNDTGILTRAIPSIETELQWWVSNRSVEVTSPYTNQIYTMYHYSVNNSAPRPESYIDDYTTAFDPTLPDLNETERSALYAELASGAETGWDYSSRFAAQPFAGGTNNTNPTLRSLQVREHVPVDLNSILYKAHALVADMYSSTGNSTGAAAHLETAASLRAGILDLNWDAEKLAFYDYNLTSGARNSIYSTATFYPLWSGIVPDEVLASAEAAFGLFAGVSLVMNRYNGSLPVTFLETGLQWDYPNAWPPHQYIVLEALAALPPNLTAGTLPTPAANESTYALVPAGQLGLAEDELPGQVLSVRLGNATKVGPAADISKLNGTVVNGGNATEGEGWADVLRREVANRYFASALCSWHATGGSIPGMLPQLPAEVLNITGSIGNTGNMFEKFNTTDVDSSGSGGEYTVQAGFGWTNGVVLYIAANYGHVLTAPDCPNILDIVGASNSSTSMMTTSTALSSSIADTNTGTTASTTGTAVGHSSSGLSSNAPKAWSFSVAAVIAVVTNVLMTLLV